jgi:hypothetical protein
MVCMFVLAFGLTGIAIGISVVKNRPLPSFLPRASTSFSGLTPSTKVIIKLFCLVIDPRQE